MANGHRPHQPHPLVLGNARLVLPDEVVIGSLCIAEGRIAALDTGSALPRGAVDLEGDLLAPGLIELHTDNLERHLQPRPGVLWPVREAIVAHDAELASVGITTVFDALRVGSIESQDRPHARKYARGLASEIIRLRQMGALRIAHRLHLRAEVCSETLIEELAEFGPSDQVGILSLMDHTPGQRQFSDVAKMRAYFQGKRGVDEAAFAAHVAELTELQARNGQAHEAAAIAEARRIGAILASHDDTTAAHVLASAEHGARVAEFPTTLAAARACRKHRIAVMMGAPNLVRGGSHSGNVATETLAEAGLLDILSSDYVPASLLQGALQLGRMSGDIAAGLATVTAAPAQAAGLHDRGRLEPGARADLICVRLMGEMALLRGVWVNGRSAPR